MEVFILIYADVRTDLAMESAEIFKQRNNLKDSKYPPGVVVEETGDDKIKISKVIITSQEGSSALGKPIGKYVTLEIPGIKDDNFEMFDASCKALSQEISNLINISPAQTVLVVGLGNWNITPDALGPKVVSQIIITRHILQSTPKNEDNSFNSIRPICAISPGVMGITGIETFEIVRGVVDRVNPDLIIVVDSLASRKAERVSTTIQLADSGISPGSGVGNRRAELSLQSLGRPVIAIGVPTVIDAATIASDAITLLLNDIKENSKDSSYDNLSPKSDLIRNLINPYYGSLIVTPKEIDEIIKRVSQVIADSINMSLGTLKN
jgi:spore protease